MAFFGELYLRSTRPFLKDAVSDAEVKFIRNALALKPTTRTLDVGCGHGRHLTRLSKHCQLFGLELDPLSIAEVQPELRARVVRGDFYAPPFRDCFDAAFAWYATLFISDSDARNLDALRAAASVLAPGGRMLVHGHSPIAEARNAESHFNTTLTDGSLLSEETWYDPVGNVLHGKRLLIQGDRSLKGEFLVRCPTLKDHERWARELGLVVDDSWGDVNGGGYTAASRDLIVRYVRG